MSKSNKETNVPPSVQEEQSSTLVDTNESCTESAPTTWKSLETQVGGHQFAHGDYGHQNLGMVDLGNGIVLKSLQNPPRGTRELNFYEKLFDPNLDDSDLLELRPFLPPFYGTEEKGKAKFLKLGNLTNGFQHPCVMDLKMGRITYDQEATAEKIEHETGKYPPLKNLGFQIIGMMVYDPETQSKEQYGKNYCRSLTEENICKDGIGRFFGIHRGDLRKDAIHPLVFKLKKLESWFLKQKQFSFIASSLLIIYEGSRITGNKLKSNVGLAPDKKCHHPTTAKINHIVSSADQSTVLVNKDDEVSHINRVNAVLQKRCNKDDELLTDEWIKKAKLADGSSGIIESGTTVDNELSDDSSKKKDMSSPLVADVHLIDFAHAFPADTIDDNFLFGLQKLISFLQSLLK